MVAIHLQDIDFSTFSATSIAKKRSTTSICGGIVKIVGPSIRLLVAQSFGLIIKEIDNE